MMFSDPITFRAKAWIKISIVTLHTSKLLYHVSLLPLKITQNQTVDIYYRKVHHKMFLLSVENDFYTFHVQYELLLVLILPMYMLDLRLSTL